jgi:hypothetical protein
MRLVAVSFRKRAQSFAGALVVAVIAIFGLGPVASGGANPSRRAATRSVSSVAPARSRTTVKPQNRGLVDKSSQTPYVLRQPFPTVNVGEIARYAAAFSGIVVNETWAQLEPSPGHFTLAPLTRSLAAVRAYNRAHPVHPLTVKLRLWGGFTAPGWAKTLGGTTPVTFSTPTASGTTGRWWTAAYRAAWSTFQHRLAASFDGDPLIGSVAVSSCATLTAEPFVQSPNVALHDELFTDGWSSASQKRCLVGAFDDYSGWRRTAIDYAFNPFVTYTPPKAAGTPDMAFTDQVMTRCADLQRTTGRSCILTNHVLTSAVLASRAAPVYTEIAALYAKHPTPVDFQTGPPDNFGDCHAINLAITYHGLSLELWPPAANRKGFKGFTAYPVSELKSWAHALVTQKPLRCK